MIYLLIATLIVVADQLLKVYASLNLKGIGEVYVIPNVMHLTYRLNEGASLGMLSGMRWFLVALSATASVGIIVALFSKRFTFAKSEKYALAAILGGAVGNLVDRIASGAVVDMLYFPWIGKIPLLPDFVCNFADFGVTFGAVFFMIFYIRREMREHKEKNADIS